jgi:hypothetical protein
MDEAGDSDTIFGRLIFLVNQLVLDAELRRSAPEHEGTRT